MIKVQLHFRMPAKRVRERHSGKDASYAITIIGKKKKKKAHKNPYKMRGPPRKLQTDFVKGS